jgi:hypothetical protein
VDQGGGTNYFVPVALALGLLIACFAQSVQVLAAPAGKTDRIGDLRRTAFVVGNSDYRHVQKLLNPSRDAKAIATTLRRIGFDVTTVIDGDKATLTDALSRFSKDSAGSDIALFFFAGHGIQVAGENYFLPVSTRADMGDAVIHDALSLNAVRRQLRKASPGLTIFLLDACRDNPFGASAKRRTWGTKAPVELRPGLAQVQSAAGMLIAYATQPGRLAYDGKSEHSPFTASLLRHLEKPGLEIRLMLGRVREDVVLHTDGAQIPWVEEAVLGEFYFSERDSGALAAGDGKVDDVTFWRSIWRSNAPADYEAYLAQYPKGAFAALAKNRLKMLKASVRTAAVTAVDDTVTRDAEQWQSIQNSLYWLGYYNGKLNGVPDVTVMNAVQAFQAGAREKPTGRLTVAQAGRLHGAAATSLVKLGERLSDRVVFDRIRLRSIDRGIDEIAQPAYEQLAAKLKGDIKGRDVLAEAKRQLDSMRRQRDAVKRQYDRATNDYVVVVAAAGAGYAEQLRHADVASMRVSDVTTTRVEALAPRRQTFLKHALEYAEKGKINEKKWLDELQ